MQVRFLDVESRFYGSVFQWIEFQIPILKMQVRFLPGLRVREQNTSKPLKSYGLAVFIFPAYPKYSLLVIRYLAGILVQVKNRVF